MSNILHSIIKSLEESRKIDINSLSSRHKGGNCYESAMKQMMDFYSKGIKDIKLVHGVVTGQGELEGVQFGHAWVELNNMVFDMSNGRKVVMLKNKYYAIGQIKITRTYDYQQMLEKVIKYETYGPWDKVFDRYY